MTAEMITEMSTRILTLTGLVSALGSLLYSSRPLLKYFRSLRSRRHDSNANGDAEKVNPRVDWPRVIFSSILLIVALTLGRFVLGNEAASKAIDKRLGPVSDPRGASSSLPETVNRLLDYLESYEDISSELQSTVAYFSVAESTKLRLKFSTNRDPEGHFTVIDEDEGRKFLQQFSKIFESTAEPRVALVRAYASLDGSTAYNRKVTLGRLREVRNLLREHYSEDSLKILGVPLGESETKDSGNDWRFVEVELVTQPISVNSRTKDPDPAESSNIQPQNPTKVIPTPLSQLVKQLKIGVMTAPANGAGTNAAISLKVGSKTYALTGEFESRDYDVTIIELDPPLELEDLRNVEITLSQDGSGFLPGWKVARVRIETSSDGKAFRFLEEWTDLGWIGKKRSFTKRLQ